MGMFVKNFVIPAVSIILLCSCSSDDPEKTVNRLISRNSVLRGTKDGALIPNIEISFSRGQMVRDDVLPIGPVHAGIMPSATCLQATSSGGTSLSGTTSVCVVTGDVQYKGVQFSRGQMYIAEEYDNGESFVFRAKEK